MPTYTSATKTDTLLPANHETFRIGLIGTGRISDIYLHNCAKFNELEIVACGSMDMAESEAKAKAFDIPNVATPDEIIASDTIDCILNLTIPSAHYPISYAALEAGKHIYTEKPFATNLVEAARLLNLAKQKNLKIGNAPDTFLGGRWQTARTLIDEGKIGDIVGFQAHVGTRGVERHHPNPDFYYQKGGGPLFDLGPYYLTALVFLLGPIARVSGLGRRTFDKRQIENGARNGQWMDVEVNTHSLSMLEFESGAIGTMMMSFDIWDSEVPRLEIYGTEGTICIPDLDPVHGANIFGGPVWYRTRQTSRWEFQPRPTDRPEQWLEATNYHNYNDNERGIGLCDLYHAILEGREPRASGALAYHVLEAMLAIEQAEDTGQFMTVKSHCHSPTPLPKPHRISV